MRDNLTGYRITYSNGETRSTSMAAHVTLKMAQDYYIGQEFEFVEGQPLVTAIKVEAIREPATATT